MYIYRILTQAIPGKRMWRILYLLRNERRRVFHNARTTEEASVALPCLSALRRSGKQWTIVLTNVKMQMLLPYTAKAFTFLMQFRYKNNAQEAI
jgi:hypothetical protein